MLALLSVVRKIIRASATPEHIGVESMKSVKSSHSCTSKIPRTIPATTPTEKISIISFICYTFRKLGLFFSSPLDSSLF